MRYLGLLVAATLLAGCTAETATVVPSPRSNTTDPPTSDAPAPPAETQTAPAEESNVIVIDVRSEEEWNGGHVEQAIHIPHTEIGERIGEVTDDKSAKIVLYCAVGGRAGVAKTKLEELGFTNVENAGGYDDVKGRFE